MDNIDPIYTPLDKNGQPPPSYMLGCGVAYEMREHPSLRYGQALVNVLHNLYPHIQVPSDVDPFYDDDKTDKFLVWLFSHPDIQRGE